MSSGHEIKRNVHVSPGVNLLLPITWGFSSSQWFIGVSSVVATKGHVASTLAGSGGVNYNCQDPCSMFFPNFMHATSTVHVQPSSGDYVAAFGLALAQSAFELAISAGLESKWFQALFAKLLGKLLAREAIAEALQKLEKQVAEEMQKKLAKALEKAIKDGVEDPLGKALKEISYGAFEDLVLEGPKRIVINILRGAAGDPIKYGVNKLKDAIIG